MLDLSPDDFRRALNAATDLVQDWYHTATVRKVYLNPRSSDIKRIFDTPIPKKDTALQEIIQEVESKFTSAVNFNISPNYYGYITGGGNQAAIIAELLKTAINQNNLKWHSSPISSELEWLTGKWVAEFCGYPATSKGTLTSGGSMGNFLSLAVARTIKSGFRVAEEGLYGLPPQTVYVSEQGHSSIDKAIDALGLGKKYLRKIPVDQQYQIRTDLLRKQILEDKSQGFHPLCIVGIAGTTNTGAIDPLDELAEIANEFACWYHVDAAYGGPAAHLETVKDLFKGMDRADSLLVNPHKWLFVPFEASFVFTRNPEHLKTTFSLYPEYLKTHPYEDGREDPMEFNLQLTKEFKSLKIWMTFQAYGSERLSAAIQNDIDLAKYAGELAESATDFELSAPVPLSIACFRYLGNRSYSEAELEHLNQLLLQQLEKDGRVFLGGTRLQGKTVLRICCINHRRRKPDIDYLFGVIREIGSLLESQI